MNQFSASTWLLYHYSLELAGAHLERGELRKYKLGRLLPLMIEYATTSPPLFHVR